MSYGKQQVPILGTSKSRASEQTLEKTVVRAGIEPATHGFSVHCSTN